MNKLFYGDNLNIMRGMPAQSVDLIYLDPPFNSKRNYNLLYKNMTGRPAPDQDIAFCDTWEMDEEKVELAKNMPILMRDYGIEDYYVEFWRLWIQALRHTNEKLLAYLIYMVQRVMQIKVILKPTGSLYLHCDPEASHYIKVMLDGIFGHRNFKGEIVWKRTSAHSGANFPGPVHDVILFYSKGPKYTWNKLYQPYSPGYEEEFTDSEDERGRYKRADLTGAGLTKDGPTGKPWRGIDVTAKGRHWAYSPETLDEMDESGIIHWPKRKGGMPRLKNYELESKGILLQDVWTDIKPIHNLSKKRFGYPTQKPINLLERIILASSDEGDVVLDPFCGCGTTLYAAQKNKRNWVGCDIAILAVQLVTNTLIDSYGLTDGKDFEVTGIPITSEQASVLFRKDPHDFQRWVVQYLEGIPGPRGSDRGVDGRVYLKNGGHIVISVKGGTIRPTDIRDLRGVLDREEDATMGCFVSLREPTKAMRQEAASAGMYEYHENKYPKIQLLTVADLLDEKKGIKSSDKFRMRKGQIDLPF